ACWPRWSRRWPRQASPALRSPPTRPIICWCSKNTSPRPWLPCAPLGIMSDMQIGSPDDPRWAQVARKLEPCATLLRAWPLQGGISAQMTALALQLPDGETRTVIVRRPGVQAMQRNPHAAAHEYQVLQIVQAAHAAAQTPYLLDQSGEIFPEPYLVMAYIEGEPDFAPARGQAIARQM